jgi:homospermidine synthase
MKRPIKQIVILGFGNIGQGLSPLLRRRFADLPVHVFDERMDATQIAIAAEYGMTWARLRLTETNFAATLLPHVGEDTLVINVATSIGSRDLIAWAQQRQAFYLDTCIDPWSYRDGELASAANTNYAIRETVLALQRQQIGRREACATAVVAHGANPGLVSLLVKEALLILARRFLPTAAVPSRGNEWARLAEALGVRVIQISERDSQHTKRPREANTFVNTWSVDGFVAEALQPVELGWGSHEAAGPLAADAKFHPYGCQAGVYFKTLGVHARVRSWSPRAGEFTGRLISHNEALSLASYLTLPGSRGPRYRPTVYYAYHPCDQAMESLDLLADGHRQDIMAERVLKDDIDDGIDELGVLLLSDRHPSLWLGSQLSIHRARTIAPHNNATSLQVVGSMLAAIEWIEANPRAGIVESEALDHDFVLAHARRYWEPMVHAFRDWHPHHQQRSRHWTIDQFVELTAPSQAAAARPAQDRDAYPGQGTILDRRRRDIGIAGRRASPHAGSDVRRRRHDRRPSEWEGTGSQAL